MTYSTHHVTDVTAHFALFFFIEITASFLIDLKELPHYKVLNSFVMRKKRNMGMISQKTVKLYKIVILSIFTSDCQFSSLPFLQKILIA